MTDAVAERGAAGQAVDDGGVGRQRDALGQAVHEHRRHSRPLVGQAGFLLDDGGQGDRLLGRAERQARAPVGPELGQQPLAGGHHPVQHHGALGPAFHLIGLRQDRAFRRRRHLAGQHGVGHEDGGRLGRRQALGDGHEVAHDAPVANHPDHPGKGGARGKVVFAGFQPPSCAGDLGGGHEYRA